MELIRKNRGRVQCPNSGCSHFVTTNVLYEDALAERRVARMRASEASQRQTQNVSCKRPFLFRIIIGRIFIYKKLQKKTNVRDMIEITIAFQQLFYVYYL